MLDYVVRFLAVATAAYVVGLVVSPAMPSYVPKLHPSFMAIGTCLFFTQGMTAYTANFGDNVRCASPARAAASLDRVCAWLCHSRASAVDTCAPRVQFRRRAPRRSLHGTIQMFGMMFVLVGAVSVISIKGAVVHSDFTVHVVLGYLTLALCLFQVRAGAACPLATCLGVALTRVPAASCARRCCARVTSR